MTYTIMKFSMIERELLEPHPDAEAFPADSDDREIVRASVGDLGILQPLIVTPKDSGGGWWVLDGVGRLRGSGAPELPCLEVECDDPRRLAMSVNSAGRKRSTGSRVLCYLMANRAAVLKAAEAADQSRLSSRDDSGKKLQRRRDIPDDLKPWGVRGIAARLGVSDKDVTAALTLMRCHEGGVWPDVTVRGRSMKGAPVEDEAALESLRRAFAAVMAGRLPVRRWQAGFAGRLATEGKGRAATDYAELGRSAAVSLKNVFEHWREVPMQARDALLNQLWETFRAAPDDVRAVAEGVFGKAEGGRA